MAAKQRRQAIPMRPQRSQNGAARPAARVDAGGVQRAIYTAISSGELVSVGILNLVRNTLVTALAGARDVGSEVGEAAVSAVRGSIRAAETIGADLGSVAKHAIRGTIEAAEEIGGELGGVARSATRSAVKATGEVRGDVADVARRAVEGTVEAARTLGADVVSIARSAAEGAVEAADRIGTAAGRSVRETLGGTVAGVRSLLVPGNGARPAARRRRRPRGTGRAPKHREDGQTRSSSRRRADRDGRCSRGPHVPDGVGVRAGMPGQQRDRRAAGVRARQREQRGAGLGGQHPSGFEDHRRRTRDVPE